MKEKDSLIDLVNFVDSNKEALKNMSMDDDTVLYYRELMAERGYECTPDEVRVYMSLVKNMAWE